MVLAESPWMPVAVSVAEGTLCEFALVLAVVSLEVTVPEEWVGERKSIPSILPVPDDDIALEVKMNAFTEEPSLVEATTEVAPITFPDTVSLIMVSLTLPLPEVVLPVLAKLTPELAELTVLPLPELPFPALSDMSSTSLTESGLPELELELFELSELESVLPEVFEFPELSAEVEAAEVLLSVGLVVKTDIVEVVVTVEVPSC